MLRLACLLVLIGLPAAADPYLSRYFVAPDPITGVTVELQYPVPALPDASDALGLVAGAHALCQRDLPAVLRSFDKMMGPTGIVAVAITYLVQDEPPPDGALRAGRSLKLRFKLNGRTCGAIIRRGVPATKA